MKGLMKREDGGAGFWASGASIFVDELGKERSRRLADLTQELKQVGAAEEKEQIKRQLTDVKVEAPQKRKNAQYSLFAKR
jgi:hypothetical protein